MSFRCSFYRDIPPLALWVRGSAEKTQNLVETKGRETGANYRKEMELGGRKEGERSLFGSKSGDKLWFWLYSICSVSKQAICNQRSDRSFHCSEISCGERSLFRVKFSKSCSLTKQKGQDSLDTERKEILGHKSGFQPADTVWTEPCAALLARKPVEHL